jgi:hypothetical protein
MVLQSIGACMLARLMRQGRDHQLESDWLLFRPTEPDVIAETQAPANDDAPAWLIAAE